MPLAVAGGGSGATDTSNGKNVPVSAETGSSSSHKGADGMYAGGGGWTGGASGEAVYHNHENSGCEKHEHSDACYYSHKHDNSCYEEVTKKGWTGNCPVCKQAWGDSDDNTCQNEKCDGYHIATLDWTEYEYTETVTVCGQEEGVDKNKLICGKKVGYQCGKDESYVESYKTASAGTNYINPEDVFSQSYGNNSGNGHVFVKSVKLGYESDTYLNDAKAEDKAAPDRPGLTLTGTDFADKKAAFSIQKPKDNGTGYTFSVEAYDQKDTKKAQATAVPDPVVLTTNVKGYTIEFYNNNTNEKVDSVSVTLEVLQAARGGMATVTSGSNVKYTRTLQSYPQLVKVYAADFAGNVSEAATLLLPSIRDAESSGTPETPATPDITYPVETEYVKAEENSNTYKNGSQKVNSLHGRGYTSGAADPDVFRVNEVSYKVLDISKNTNVSDPDTTYEVYADDLDSDFTQTGYGIPTEKTQIFDAYGSPEYKRDTENGQKYEENMKT